MPSYTLTGTSSRLTRGWNIRLHVISVLLCVASLSVARAYVHPERKAPPRRRFHSPARVPTHRPPGSSLPLRGSTAAAALAAGAITLPGPLSSLSLGSLTSAAVPPSPALLFSGLIAAGFGLPVSEDALIIYAGTFLGKYAATSRTASVLFALYAGVVLSDLVMYCYGRLLRRGVAAPLRKFMLGDGARCSLETGTCTVDEENSRWSQASPRMKACGKYVGVAVRLSVGIRGPLMMLTGFSSDGNGKGVSLPVFAAGSCFGALLSLPLQLGTGWMLRDNPGAVGAAVAVAGTAMAAAMVTAAAGSIGGILLKRRRRQEV